jgi:hypothetical protein
MGIRGRAVTICAGVILALLTPAAGAERAAAEIGQAALDALTAADRATRLAAASGFDVVQQVSLGSRADLETGFKLLVHATVPAGGRVRVHVTVNPDEAFYLSVRRQPGTRLLAAAGRQSETAALWATVSMLESTAARHARSAGALDRTAITGLTGPDFIADYQVAESPLVMALDLLLPPYSGSQDEGWTTVTTVVRADGTTLISGSIAASVPASDGEDKCVRPLVEIVVGPDSIARSSHWRETCPGRGTREYRATASYGVQPIQPPTLPRMSAARALP